MTEAPANGSRSDEPARPVPPRYWWLKRILLAVGVLILALAALRWWWGYEAERRLQAKIDEYHAAGQPVTIEDFQFPPVPDEENAAHFLMQAASALVRPALADAAVEELYSYPQAIPAHGEAVRRWIDDNAKALRLAREARSRDQVDWQLRFRSPVITIVLPQLSPQRQLAKFLCTTALFQHQTGDDASAVETLRDVLAQGKKVGEMRGFLIGHLVAISIDALAADTVEFIAPTLRVAGTRGPQEALAAPTTPQQVRALIADLLDEEPLREGWRRAMYTERLMAVDGPDVAVSSPGTLFGGAGLPPKPIGWVLAPMFQLDGLFMMEYYTAYGEAGAAADYPTAKALLVPYPAFPSRIERSARILSRILLPSLDRVAELHFRAIATRRLVAAALAVRLYEIDHGKRPETLDMLVPRYLPAVPVDPFAADGRPLGYLPHAPKPVVYSVNADDVDDGGAYALTKRGSVDQNLKDLVFFLNGNRPRAPPPTLTSQPTTTQAVEDDGDEVGDCGQADKDEAADD